MSVKVFVTSSRTHTLIGYANPFLVCDTCKSRVNYWHNPDRCGCDDNAYNSPCEHALGVTSICPTWNSVIGCNCTNKETHNKE